MWDQGICSVRTIGPTNGNMTRHEPHNCPYCELAFWYHNEVVDHIQHDHPKHRSVVDNIEPRELPRH